MTELLRIGSVLSERRRNGQPPSTSVIGLRINPIVSGGSIGMFAVSSSPESKFGHPIYSEPARRAVLEAFAAYPWLSGLHCHVGSAGTSLSMLAEGAKKLCDLASEVDEHCGTKRVNTIDIGGGLATNYESEEVTPTFEEYATVLQSAAPSLFSDSSRRVFTEFGRSLTNKSGWIVSQVEYAQEFDDDAEQPTRTVIGHAGADLLLRACYRPDIYAHRIGTFDGQTCEPLEVQRPHSYGIVQHNLAGPLCFAGDYVKKGVELPHRLEPGDFVVVHDAGANTLALWSRHCSRLAPPVFTYERVDDGELSVKMRMPGERLERVLDFWRG